MDVDKINSEKDRLENTIYGSVMRNAIYNVCGLFFNAINVQSEKVSSTRDDSRIEDLGELIETLKNEIQATLVPLDLLLHRMQNIYSTIDVDSRAKTIIYSDGTTLTYIEI